MSITHGEEFTIKLEPEQILDFVDYDKSSKCMNIVLPMIKINGYVLDYICQQKAGLNTLFVLYRGDVDVTERCRPQYAALFIDRFERKTVIVLLGLVRDLNEALRAVLSVAN